MSRSTVSSESREHRLDTRGTMVFIDVIRTPSLRKLDEIVILRRAHCPQPTLNPTVTSFFESDYAFFFGASAAS